MITFISNESELLFMARPKGIPNHNKGKILVERDLIKCKYCNTEFISYKSAKRKFCNRECGNRFRIGKKKPQHSLTMIKVHKIKKFGYQKGQYKGDLNPAKRLDVRQKISIAASIWQLGENNNKWKGGIGNLYDEIRSSGIYRHWRKRVVKRDNYNCIKCNTNKKLEVDHINSFAEIIRDNNIKNINEAINCNKLWDLDNGRTLCYDCHRKTKSYGKNLK